MYDDEEIKKLRTEWPNMSREDKIDHFLWKMVWFHHTKHIAANPNQAIKDLTETLKDADESATRFSKVNLIFSFSIIFLTLIQILVALFSFFKGWWFFVASMAVIVVLVFIFFKLNKLFFSKGNKS